MVSKTFFLIVLAFATVLLITSEVVAANESASRNEVKDAKHHRDGYYNDGPGGDYDGGCGRYRNGGGGYGGGYCRYGCCGGGGGYDDGRCRCCISVAEATAYKQAHNKAPPAHN